MQKPRYEGAGEKGEAKDKERARRPKKKYANVAKRKGKPRGIAIIPLVSRRRGLFATDATEGWVSGGQYPRVRGDTYKR
jgi:hypothetical protein